MGSEITRSLATISRITNIEPIEGADRIVKATVNNYPVVTQKSNNLKIGDLVCYMSVDAFLPIHPMFDWLYKGAYKSVPTLGEGYRIKTIRLRGQLSQGLIFPLTEKMGGFIAEFASATDLENTAWGDFYRTVVNEGADVTEVLGVKKYELPLPAQLAGMVRSTFPAWIRKTDQERIQTCYNWFTNKWNDYTWEVTMKLDGSSCTIFYNKERNDFGVCSRNMDLRETEGNAYWNVARHYNLEERLSNIGRSLAIQGELIGPGVQGNPEDLKALDLYVFDIFDIETQKYLSMEERHKICLDLDLKHVPIIAQGFKYSDFTVDDFLKMAEGPSLNADKREGIVFKSIEYPDVSFKAISNSWLLNEQ